MISVSEAVRIVAERTRRLGTETVSLGEALGAVLAADVSSDVDIPPFDRAMMDGYAVRSVDLAGLPAELEVVEEQPEAAAASDDQKIPFSQPVELELAEEGEAAAAESDEEPIELELATDEKWNLPQEGELRDLLSQIDKPKKPRARKAPAKPGAKHAATRKA